LCGVAVVETNNNMKNIYLIPTDKPSRLADMEGLLVLGDNLKSPIGHPTMYLYQNIYITSDEEIKEGDWMYYKHFREDIVCKYDTMNGQNTNVNEHKPFYQKIILTTDQDLIKDGVQAIDYDFLEWFVKNPSCESVKTERLEDGKYVDYLPDGSTFEGVYENYKIIIPKEEPTEEAKERAANYMRLKGALEVKEETLEEAAERLYPFALDGIGNVEVDKKNHFIKGAKWQQEQDKIMYSKLSIYLQELADKDRLKSLTSNQIRTAIEQFKKK
jgi:hypothetical protein